MADIQKIKECLKALLGDDTSDDIAEYVLQMQNEEDYNEFMENLVDLSKPEHIDAYERLKLELLGSKAAPVKKYTTPGNVHSSNSKQKTKNYENSQKSHNANNAKSQRSINNENCRKPQNGNGIKPRKSVNNENSQKLLSVKSGNPQKTTNNEHASNQMSAKGKKLKFVNFYNKENKPGLKKGRHPCDCQALEHDLINNCTKCGRIVCEQEGSGPCFFCNNMVCTREEMELLAANSKESDKLYNYLMEKSNSKEWKKALETRDRLVRTDRQGDGKNIVYDDQSDYFSMNKWSSPEEQKRNKKRLSDHLSTLHKPRSEVKMSLDFATRTVAFEKTDDIVNKDKLMKGVNKLLDNSYKRFPNNLFSGDKAQLMEEICAKMEKAQISDVPKHTTPNLEDNESVITAYSEEDDKIVIPEYSYKSSNSEFLESLDHGMCLSMHQPYASLLVAGIKKHEGRTWKTTHRGRLWIAAASRHPEDEEILECEEMYKLLYKDNTLTFPKKYPTGCLLGCVYVEDCLPQHEYREKYPNGESNSPYVLICKNPVILPIFYPMSGQHKIFALNKDIHRKAKAALMSARWV